MKKTAPLPNLLNDLLFPYYQSTPSQQVSIQGYSHPKFALTKKLLQNEIAQRGQGGAALAIYYKGEPVVDIWGGLSQTNTPWQQDTLALCFSTGKGVLATIVHRLADEKILDYNTPISQFWPEFAQNNKAEITIKDVLCHESGLYDIRHVIPSAATMLYWPEMLDAYAAATPRYAVGQKVAYGALSMGFILGGVIEKATGQSVKQLLEQYVTIPLHLNNQMFFGLDDNAFSRVAQPLALESIIQKRMNKPLQNNGIIQKEFNKNKRRPLNNLEKIQSLTGQNPYDADDAFKPHKIGAFNFYSSKALKACIPSANGVFTARSLAKMYGAIANNGAIDQYDFLSPKTVYNLSQIQNNERDLVMPTAMQWRLGYHRIFTLGQPCHHAFGHFGYNGTFAWCDPSRNISVAFTHNYMDYGMLNVRPLILAQRILGLVKPL